MNPATTSGTVPANRLDRRKARTRQALIDAAVGLIAQGRGERASIQEVTEAADIGFGSFYNHFASKEEFTPDPSIAFAEIHRVLRPDGRLGALTWGGIEHNPWLTCVGMAAMANGLVSGGPPVGPGGIFSLGDPAELEAVAKGAGFVDVAVEEFAITFLADTIDAHVERVSSLAGPLATVLQAASPDQLAALRRTAADLAAPYVTDNGLEIPGQALLVQGRR